MDKRFSVVVSLYHSLLEDPRDPFGRLQSLYWYCTASRSESVRAESRSYVKMVEFFESLANHDVLSALLVKMSRDHANRLLQALNKDGLNVPLNITLDLEMVEKAKKLWEILESNPPAHKSLQAEKFCLHIARLQDRLRSKTAPDPL